MSKTFPLVHSSQETINVSFNDNEAEVCEMANFEASYIEKISDRQLNRIAKRVSKSKENSDGRNISRHLRINPANRVAERNLLNFELDDYENGISCDDLPLNCSIYRWGYTRAPLNDPGAYLVIPDGNDKEPDHDEDDFAADYDCSDFEWDDENFDDNFDD